MTTTGAGMQGRALVVHESMFGNTGLVARAVARGLEAEGWVVGTVAVTDAPALLPADVTLLVVGAPTHAFSLSRPSTRAEAIRRGARVGVAELGVREWLATVKPWVRWPPLAVFDTRVASMRLFPKVAGRRVARIARHRGFTEVGHPASFLVTGTQGPLAHDELARAEAWGHALGGSAIRVGSDGLAGRA